MLREEIERRVAAGEKPAALSLEHWQRNRKRCLVGEEIWLGETHCACCVVYIPNCLSCPVRNCHAVTAPYSRVLKAKYHGSTKEGLLQAIDNMIRVLQEVVDAGL